MSYECGYKSIFYSLVPIIQFTTQLLQTANSKHNVTMLAFESMLLMLSCSSGELDYCHII